MKIQYESVRKFAPLAVIAFIAIMSGYLVYNYLRNSSDALEKKYAERAMKDMVNVVVAGSNLPAGAVASNQTMAIRKIPKGFLPAGYVTPEAADQYWGRKVVVPMQGGTPLSSAFLETHVFTPFSQTIEKGLRAITIPVDEVNSISGLLRAGDHLDLYLTATDPFLPVQGQSSQVVLPLLQDLQVQATGQLTKEETENRNKLMATNSNVTHNRYATITVAVSQENAQKLIMAEQVGKITAVLRNTQDKGEANRVVTMKNLFDGTRLAATNNDKGISILYLIGGGGIKKIQEQSLQPSPPRQAPSL